MAANTISLSISPSVAASKNLHSLQSRAFIAPRTISFPLASSNYKPGDLSLSVSRSRVRAGASQLMNEPVDEKRSITSPTVVQVDLGNRSYPIYIGAGLLDQSQLLQRSHLLYHNTFPIELLIHSPASNWSNFDILFSNLLVSSKVLESLSYGICG